MGVEIERKFLVDGDGWRQGTPVQLSQGYLSTDKSRTVRVRIAGSDAFLTIKGLTTNLSRAEFEYSIPLADAKDMLSLCVDHVIKKERYTLPIGDIVWEIDVFHGENEGLVVAEVELQDESQLVDLPDWIGDEVSHESQYFNSSLAMHPFSRWDSKKTIR